MSDDTNVPDVQNDDPIQKLRDEMAEQFATLKQSFESELSERDSQITKLKEENDSLHRALIRSAMTTPPTEVPKTEEQLYSEQVQELADKTLQKMKLMWS